ncbi:hypothetical protein MB02_06230 [Croceicoccus estronivorus]|nr:hypothetical protein MB02_06230 [Croceicoccus estronivorus]
MGKPFDHLAYRIGGCIGYQCGFDSQASVIQFIDKRIVFPDMVDNDAPASRPDFHFLHIFDSRQSRSQPLQMVPCG